MTALDMPQNSIDLLQQVNTIVHQAGAALGKLGFAVTEIALPTVTCVLPFHPSQIRPGNTISGPTMMLLADAAMYALVLACDPDKPFAVTQDLHIHFLSRPEPADLTAVATLLKPGKRTRVMRVDIYSGEKLVAHATGSYALVNVGGAG